GQLINSAVGTFLHWQWQNSSSSWNYFALPVGISSGSGNFLLAVASGSEPVVAPVSAPMPNLKPSIPYPARRDHEKRRDQANEQIEKFYEIFKEMSFEISFTDTLILMPKFASTLKALIGNKEKLSEMARTTMNEHCSAVILNKLPRKLGDPRKFLIPCEFSEMDECLALADLGASINLMPLSVWEGILLPELTPTCMTLKLADRSVSKPIGIAKDVSFKVEVFHFPADFVVVDFEPDPRVPLILGRCFLKTSRALIDVHKGELTLRIGNEAITYNLDQTVRYSANYNQITANKIDVIESACEEYSQEVLGFSNVIASVTPTPQNDLIVSATSPTLTPFGDSDFLLFEEADEFLGLKDDPDSPKINPFYYDPEGDILLLEAILNSEPSPPLSNQEQNLPSFKEELKAYEAQTVKLSVDEPPEVELKDLPHHLEYVFLEGENKLPGINPEFCTHKILVEEDYKPAVQHQRRVNLKIHNVIKKEVEKLLDAGLIYPISDSPWVSPTGSPGTFKFPLNLLIKKRQRSPAHMARLPTVACLLACAMLQALFKGELKVCEAKTVKSSVDEPPEVELKDLPPHLEYVFLEGDNKLPVINSKELGDEEKPALIKVLKSHKQEIAWKLSDIQGINPEFYTHKILMEEDYKPAVQHQRRVNPKIHDVIKKEVKKLLDAGLIYPISDSPWVSPVHCVPKKGGFTVVENEENKLIPTRLVTGCGKRQRSPAHMARLPIDACLSVCAMHRGRFKGVCWPFFTTWLRREWKSLWTTSRSLGILLRTASLV
nr:reverse transcriptase domain-containing protein [Tanacetum cinerariifolium]